MTAPTALTILQLGAPLAAAALVGGTLLMARAVENSRERRAVRKSRRTAAGQHGSTPAGKPLQHI